MSRRLALVLVMVVCGVLLWLALHRTQPSAVEETDATKAGDPQGAGAQPPAVLRGLDADSREDQASTSASLGQEPAVDDGDPDESGAPLRTLRGTVLLLDAQGQPVPASEGKLWVAVGPEDDPEGAAGQGCVVAVPVVDGAWAMEAARGLRVMPLRFEREGQYGLLNDRRNLANTDFARIHARLLPRTLLHVLDAETGAPLADVRLVRSMSYRWYEHPGRRLQPKEILVAAGASPLVVPPAGWRADAHDFRFCVAAPGHAFVPMQVDLLAGGERTIRLPAGGALRVELRGEVSVEGRFVRASRQVEGGGGLVRTLSLSLEDALEGPIGQLTPGPYVVRAQLGAWWDEGETLAEARCQVEAGAQTDVLLDVTAPREVDLVSASGVLRIDSTWELEEVDLTLTYLDARVGGRLIMRSFGRWGDFELVPVAGVSGAYRFDMGRVPAGRYQVSVRTLQYNGEITVPARGGRDLRIDIAPPATLVVRIVDLPDGSPSEARSLFWWMAPPEGAVAYSVSPVEIPAGRDAAEFRVPPGAIVMKVNSDWHSCEALHVKVQSGQRKEVTLAVTPSGNVAIAFRDGTTPIPTPGGWVDALTSVSGAGEASLWARQDGAALVWVTKPGTYRVTFNLVPDYAPVEPCEVQIEAGKTTRLEIELKK